MVMMCVPTLALSVFKAIVWQIMIIWKRTIALLSEALTLPILAGGKKTSLPYGILSWKCLFISHHNIPRQQKQPLLCSCSFADTEKSFELYCSRIGSNQHAQSRPLSAVFTSLAKRSLPHITGLWSECPDSLPMRLLLLFCHITLPFPT